ncbi:GNAT family N-acetyltransferase [Aquibacillus sp. 3ASR75-11]|uniref:GNAT family N-acetyltransferase n=1 Tax=Terrihalobacillus insolitus TaxID=2950438 RepID=A0A9X3WV85_9BACI|nr:GNAT family N-acetyltransferase [Terrihalobacillus insolitus]MDC3424681.1 GNAT family N-acetyltransferase [Terrihalobacillus insolitus]
MYQIRKADLKDAEAIAHVHVESWKSTYSELINEKDLTNTTFENRKALWETILKMPKQGQVVMVVEDENRVIGFVSGGKERTKRFGFDGEIYAIYLLDDYQRKKLGTKLLQAFVAELKTLGYRSILVWVLTQNPSSKFYERLGAEPIQKEQTTIGEGTYQETAYGWEDINELTFQET